MNKVAVLGAGTMGHGIAQICAVAGMEVALRDLNDELIGKGRAGIEASLGKLVDKGKVEAAARDAALARISTTTDLAAAVKDADLVVEAIPELMPLKVETFRALAAHAPPHAILATNTSSLSVTEIGAASGTPERVVGLHFFNPVP
ncbi:MAG: 3-hydroxybutyryl-CoA dehydrogenase, partial [Myxococcales bacterium]|nr:3-hydroxybutyryl-CoA dehydrogenase [Myxococcales bacterium]